MTFDTKIALVIRQDLATWQKLNVAAFLTAARFLRKLHPTATWKARLCSFATENTISCGRKAAGQAPITASPTLFPTHHLVLFSASAKSSSRMPASPLGRGITRSFQSPTRTNGISPTIVVHSAKRTATPGKYVWSSYFLTKRDLSNL